MGRILSLPHLGLATNDDTDRLQATVKTELQSIQFAARELELHINVRLGGMIVALGGILIAIKYFG